MPIGCGIFLREKGSGGGSLTRLIGPSRDKALKGRWPDAGTSVREDDDLYGRSRIPIVGNGSCGADEARLQTSFVRYAAALHFLSHNRIIPRERNERLPQRRILEKGDVFEFAALGEEIEEGGDADGGEIEDVGPGLRVSGVGRGVSPTARHRQRNVQKDQSRHVFDTEPLYWLKIRRR